MTLKQRQRAAHAEADDADARSAALAQIARRASGVLRRGVGEIEAFHQVVRLVAGGSAAAAIKIGHEHVEPVRR